MQEFDELHVLERRKEYLRYFGQSDRCHGFIYWECKRCGSIRYDEPKKSKS